MLKITIRTDATAIILELEGKLVGPWVQELAACWQQVATAARPVRLVLRCVTFIDDAGRKLLAEMHQDGAELTAEGCMTRAIVEQITRGG